MEHPQGPSSLRPSAAGSERRGPVPLSTRQWRLSDEAREGDVAPELLVCETFGQQLAFDHLAVALALSPEVAWVLHGSDADLHRLIMHEQTVLQGPHVDALSKGTTVRVQTGHELADRWPLLAASGGPGLIGSGPLLVVPLASSPHIPAIGTFAVSRDSGARFTQAEVEQATGFASLVAGMLIARWQAVHDVDRLDGLIHDHRHLAAGMLASYLGVRTPQAMAIMRARAFGTGRTLRDLSADIVVSLGVSVPG